uniref:phenylalanyl-tRNA synthetase beta chain n=1 Tax=Ahnfeltia fastigiata TaxID=31363 RepID=UPI001D11A487|nr:phenylalanyl-tRNA synthetase beta chain [Ahnfeltia fastigiata]UAT97526.1 phenylalanyl-tRNA synthetase beta chain [Ahnfeltia fastigiata]
MKVSWNWLSQMVNLNNITCNELASKLTLAGFEVEDIQYNENIKDTMIDLSITANRSDLLNMIGIAREIATILKVPLIKQRDQYTPEIDSPLNIKNKNYCHDLHFNIITNINYKKSPAWLKNYLIIADINPSDTLRDIISYISLKWGQDIQAFDISKLQNENLKGSEIYIEQNTNYNQIVSSRTIEFIENEIPFTLNYKNFPLSIIGIESNTNLSCNSVTSSIILFGNICQINYIKNITEQLNLKTETSSRQLRGISRNDFNNAYQETKYLITKLCHGIAHKGHCYHELPNKIVQIEIKVENINNILGPLIQEKSSIELFLSVKDIIKILTNLRFKPKLLANTKSIRVSIPDYRINDIYREIDVIEEIGRIYGFEKFIDLLPESIDTGKFSTDSITINKLRNILRNLGLDEVVHYSLETKILQTTESIALYNPLIKDQSLLRTNLVASLINAKSNNLKQSNKALEAFEIGRVFEKNVTSNTRIENVHIGGILGRYTYNRHKWTDKPKELSWFQAKGNLEEFFEHLHANISWSQQNAKSNWLNQITKFFHPQRVSIILNDNKEIGIFGQINIRIAKKLNLKDTTYLFEINLNRLLQATRNLKHLNYIIKTYSYYPSVTRDISITVSNNTSVKFVKEQIRKNSIHLLESVELFDEYKSIEHNQKIRHLSFRITYRSQNRTLTGEDIVDIDNTIQKLIQHQFI